MDCQEDLAAIELGEIAFLSGVEAEAIAAAMAGTARLDRLHLEAIARALPGVDLSALRTHHAPAPASSSTRRGRVPAGFDLLLVEAERVRPGDLLVYTPPGAAPGAHWLEVLHSGSRGFVHVLVVAGGHEIVTRMDAPYRLARPRL